MEGEINLNRIQLKAIEYDVIHSDFDICYELDFWDGMLINETTIEGDSLDDQGISGSFKFERIVEK